MGVGGPHGTLGSPAPSDLIAAGSTAVLRPPGMDEDLGSERGLLPRGLLANMRKGSHQKLRCKWSNPLTYVYVCSQSVSG